MSEALRKRSPLDPVPTAGAYLARRRAVAGLNRVQVAQRLAVMPWMLLEPSGDDVARLADRLFGAERNGKNFSEAQIKLVRGVFPFDPFVYLQLIAIEAAAPGHKLQAPRICVDCACTHWDPCHTGAGSCAWSADPTRCTACAPDAAPASAALERAA